jgi:hypothetical protein
VIGRIERIKLDANETPSQAVEKPGTSQKIPKWIILNLESVHPDEARNIGTKSSTRQYDGGDVDNSH